MFLKLQLDMGWRIDPLKNSMHQNLLTTDDFQEMKN